MNERLDPDQPGSWGVVWGVAVLLGVSLGATIASFGVFTLPIVDIFRVTKEQAGLVAGAFMLTMTLAMPVVGWLLDRVPPTQVTVSGAAMAALGYALAANATGVDSLVLAMAIAGIGIGFSTYVPGIVLVTRQVLPARHGLAMGILLAAISLGSVVFPPLMTAVIAAYGLRSALAGIGAGLFFPCVPFWFWVARKSAQQSPIVKEMSAVGGDIRATLLTGHYWSWVMMLMLITVSVMGVFMALIPHLVSVGYSPGQAAAFGALTGVATLVGSYVFAMVGERLGNELTLLLGTSMTAFGTLVLIGAADSKSGLGAVILFTIAWGATSSLASQLSPLLLLEIVGQRNFGGLLGLGNLIAGIASAFSPQAVGYLSDRTETYVIALQICAALLAVALIPLGHLWRLTRRKVLSRTQLR